MDINHHFERACEIDREKYKDSCYEWGFCSEGEPAVINRWKLSRDGFKNGIDMVVELQYFILVRVLKFLL